MRINGVFKENTAVKVSVFITAFLSLPAANAHAMHIMEGFLPPGWCIAWGALCIPFIVKGLFSVKKKVAENSKMLLLLAMCGAFAFVLSALKLPSVTGSSSHPTGVGLGAILFGPTAMSLIGIIVLLFQAILLAHGGLTTLGANAFSMGIAGPFAAYFTFWLLRKIKAKDNIAVFCAAFAGDIFTYIVTSFQLGLAFPDAGGGVAVSIVKFLGVFAFTQLPLAVSEGILTVIVYNSIKKYSLTELDALNVSDSVPMHKHRRKKILLIALALVICAFSLIFSKLDFVGSDDRAGALISQINPGYLPWFNSVYEPPGDDIESLLFTAEAAAGCALFIFCFLKLSKRHSTNHDQFGGIDKYAHQSKLYGIKASTKLAFSLILMLICLVFSSNLISLLTVLLTAAATVFLGGCKPERYLSLMLIPFAFLFTGVITIVISKIPNTDGALFYFPLFGSLYGITPTSLRVGINLLLKSLGAVSCLYFFSLNTPMNSFLSFMRKRVPGVFVELMELIYRFIFIIWDESRRIYTAQNSRLGYRGFKNSMKSLGELVTTVFIRALRRVDRISVALESRGFDGNFDFLLEEERPSVLLKALTVLSSLTFITIGILERLHK